MAALLSRNDRFSAYPGGVVPEGRDNRPRPSRRRPRPAAGGRNAPSWTASRQAMRAASARRHREAASRLRQGRGYGASRPGDARRDTELCEEMDRRRAHGAKSPPPAGDPPHGHRGVGRGRTARPAGARAVREARAPAPGFHGDEPADACRLALSGRAHCPSAPGRSAGREANAPTAGGARATASRRAVRAPSQAAGLRSRACRGQPRKDSPHGAVASASG